MKVALFRIETTPSTAWFQFTSFESVSRRWYSRVVEWLAVDAGSEALIPILNIGRRGALVAFDRRASGGDVSNARIARGVLTAVESGIVSGVMTGIIVSSAAISAACRCRNEDRESED
jgi:hypothetical protein